MLGTPNTPDRRTISIVALENCLAVSSTVCCAPQQCQLWAHSYKYAYTCRTKDTQYCVRSGSEYVRCSITSFVNMNTVSVSLKTERAFWPNPIECSRQHGEGYKRPAPCPRDGGSLWCRLYSRAFPKGQAGARLCQDHTAA